MQTVREFAAHEQNTPHEHEKTQSPFQHPFNDNESLHEERGIIHWNRFYRETD
jgi:hypothetical protein